MASTSRRTPKLLIRLLFEIDVVANNFNVNFSGIFSGILRQQPLCISNCQQGQGHVTVLTYQNSIGQNKSIFRNQDPTYALKLNFLYMDLAIQFGIFKIFFFASILIS